MPTATDNLTMRAAALARAAPDQWRDFLAAFADFTEHHRENLVNSQLDTLPVNQGRASLVSAINKSFRECLSNAEKMKPKEK